VAYEDAVEEALCYGWIDGQVRPIDERRTSQLFTPRRPGSTWARSNKARVRRLIASGRMRRAGLQKIEAAKRDGSWMLLERVESLRVPADLARALRAAGATRRFNALASSAKQLHLWSIASAKRPETRARRLAAILRSLRA
jgi:uncharacterized protein YdeI (YjbR/CyaY-like superfamily)